MIVSFRARSLTMFDMHGERLVRGRWCDLLWLVEPDGAEDYEGVSIRISEVGSPIYRP
jgi:hypothetical protein